MNSLAWQDGEVQLAYAVHNHMQILFYSQSATGSIYTAMSSPQIGDIDVMADGSCRMTLHDTVPLFFSNTYLRTLRIFDEGAPDYENVAIDGSRYACGPGLRSTVSDGCIFTRLEPGANIIGSNGAAMGTTADFNIGTLHYAIGEGDLFKQQLNVSEFPSCRRTVATSTPGANVFRSSVDRKVNIPVIRDVRFMPYAKRARGEAPTAQQGPTQPQAQQRPTQPQAQQRAPQSQAQQRPTQQSSSESRVKALVARFRQTFSELEIHKTWHIRGGELSPELRNFEYTTSASVNQVIVGDGRVVVPADEEKAKVFGGITIDPTMGVLFRKESVDGIRVLHQDQNVTMPIQLAIGFLFAYIISLERSRQ